MDCLNWVLPPHRSQRPEDTLPRKGADRGDSPTRGENVADPLLNARVLCVLKSRARDRHWKFRDAVAELVESP